MPELSFDSAAAELAKLYRQASPFYARHLVRDIFNRLLDTLELAYVLKGNPPDMAKEKALVRAYELTGQKA